MARSVTTTCWSRPECRRVSILSKASAPTRTPIQCARPVTPSTRREGWQKLIRDPGPVVVGASQGASCMGAGYEFLFNLEYAARQAGVRDKIDITWITPEPFLGHFGIGGMAGGEAMLKSFMKMFHINYVVNSEIEEITETEVVLKDGRRLPYKYSMIIPPFNGAKFVKESGDLGDEKGFIPVERITATSVTATSSPRGWQLRCRCPSLPRWRSVSPRPAFLPRKQPRSPRIISPN